MATDGRKLRVKNWEQFQHYKDRRPPWIKLHIALLDDYEFALLDDAQRWHLMGIWILASTCDNRLPYNANWIGRRINASGDVDLDALVAAGWLEFAEGDEPRADWSSRYISKKVRAAVLERDGHQCCACGSPDRLEIDHILPVSKGGTSDPDNLQTLCRSCNRKKRARATDHRNDTSELQGYADAEQFATDVRSESLHSNGALARSREEKQRREESEPRTRVTREATAVPDNGPSALSDLERLQAQIPEQARPAFAALHAELVRRVADPAGLVWKGRNAGPAAMAGWTPTGTMQALVGVAHTHPARFAEVVADICDKGNALPLDGTNAARHIEHLTKREQRREDNRGAVAEVFAGLGILRVETERDLLLREAKADRADARERKPARTDL